MNSYAIIRLAGKQYKVSEGTHLEVNKLDNKEGETFKVTDVIAVRNGENLLVGNPFVQGAKVTVKIEKHLKGKKIEVRKFKAKVRYRRHIGFRPQLTRLQVQSIETEKKEVTAPATKKRTRTKKT